MTAADGTPPGIELTNFDVSDKPRTIEVLHILIFRFPVQPSDPNNAKNDYTIIPFPSDPTIAYHNYT